MASQFPNNLHNFELPELWGNDTQSRVTKRPRSYKPPSQKTSASPATPLPQPLVSAAPSSPHQSLPRDSPVIQSCVSPVQGDSSKSPLNSNESKKESRIGGEPEKPNLNLKEALIMVKQRDELVDQRKSKCENSLDKSKETANDDPTSKRSKILIKLPSKMNKEEGRIKSAEHERERDVVLRREDINALKDVDDDTTIRELRPRRPKVKLPTKKSGEEGSGGDKKEKVGGSGGDKEKGGSNDGTKGVRGGDESKEKVDCDEKNESEKMEENVESKGGIEEEKKFGIKIPLTKREIEEDVFALTGTMPSKRPKKRPKNVQRNLNVTFPGLCLSSITPGNYKVARPSKKRRRR